MKKNVPVNVALKGAGTVKEWLRLQEEHSKKMEVYGRAQNKLRSKWNGFNRMSYNDLMDLPNFNAHLEELENLRNEAVYARKVVYDLDTEIAVLEL